MWMEPRMRLEGKVAIITGGGTGLGLAGARRVAQEGARLVLAGRRPEALAAAVGGVIGFTQALAREVGPAGIRVNAICPGPTLTEGMIRGFQERAQYGGMTYEEVVAWSANRSALRRLTQPEDFAAVALFLCSDEAG